MGLADDRIMAFFDLLRQLYPDQTLRSADLAHLTQCLEKAVNKHNNRIATKMESEKQTIPEDRLECLTIILNELTEEASTVGDVRAIKEILDKFTAILEASEATYTGETE